VDAHEAGDIAYMLANGQGKSRSRNDGSSRAPTQWRLLYLSTGGVSLADKMNEARRKSRTGQEVRLVDIPADTGNEFSISEYLYDFASAYFFLSITSVGYQQVLWDFD